MNELDNNAGHLYWGGGLRSIRVILPILPAIEKQNKIDGNNMVFASLCSIMCIK